MAGLLSMTYRLGQTLESRGENLSKQVRSAINSSLAVTGYKYARVLRNELKSGGIGLKPKSLYRNDPRDPRFKKSRSKFAAAPLTALWRGILYQRDKVNMSVSLGFHGSTEGTEWQKLIARSMLEDSTIAVTDELRKAGHIMGIHLRKTTTSIHVPARDIAGTFWEKHRVAINAEIKSNFKRKMRGERI